MIRKGIMNIVLSIPAAVNYAALRDDVKNNSSVSFTTSESQVTGRKHAGYWRICAEIADNVSRITYSGSTTGLRIIAGTLQFFRQENGPFLTEVSQVSGRFRLGSLALSADESLYVISAES